MYVRLVHGRLPIVLCLTFSVSMFLSRCLCISPTSLFVCPWQPPVRLFLGDVQVVFMKTTHTHTHTQRTHTHTHTHTITHTNTHIHTQICSATLRGELDDGRIREKHLNDDILLLRSELAAMEQGLHTQTRTHSHTHTRTHTLSHTLTILAYTSTHTPVLTHIYMYTYTHNMLKCIHIHTGY